VLTGGVYRTAIPALRSFASRAMAAVLLPRDNRRDAGGGGGARSSIDDAGEAGGSE